MARPKKGADGYYRLNFTHNGKKFSVRSKDPKKLNAKMLAKIKELESNYRVVTGDTMVQDWGEQWRATYQSSVRKTSQERVASTLRCHVYPLIGLMALKTVRPIHLQEVLNEMAGKGLARDTVKHCLQYLQGMFARAIENHLLADDPSKGLTLPVTKEPGSHRCMTARERAIFMRTVDLHPAEGLWPLLMLSTGLRPGETVPLTGRDLSGGMVHVYQAYDGRTGEIKPPKSKAGIRAVPIIPRLAAAMPPIGPFDLVFTQYNGKPMTKSSMRRRWMRWLRYMAEVESKMIESGELPAIREELPTLRIYDLRHTYCTDLERAQVSITTASKLMGHSKTELTSRIYTHTDADMIIAAGTALADLWRTGDDVCDDNKPPKGASKRTIYYPQRKKKNTG